jgi:hypothetical protein
VNHPLIPAPCTGADDPQPHRCRRRPTPNGGRRPTRWSLADDRGQATAEYALVMLAAAAIAGLLLAWAASTDGIGRLLDTVMESIIGDAS